MLNKKRLFALLMVGALLPTCVNAMDGGDADGGDGGGAAAAAGGGGAPVVAPAAGGGAGDGGGAPAPRPRRAPRVRGGGGNGGGGAPAPAPAPADGGGVMGMIDKGCDLVNTPLKIAMEKVTAFGAKSKLLITGLLAYVGWCAKDKVVEDVQELPNTVKALVGGDADCDGGECRRATWTEEA